jgi:hypothetical protein
MAIVLDGVAVIVPPGDVNALSMAMTRLVKSPTDRAKFGMLGRDHARRLWDRDTLLHGVFSLP